MPTGVRHSCGTKGRAGFIASRIPPGRVEGRRAHSPISQRISAQDGQRNDQEDPKSHKVAQHGPRRGQDRPKKSPRRPKMGPRWAQEGPRQAQEGPRWPQDGPKMAPRWAQDGPKIALGRLTHIKLRKKSVRIKRSAPFWPPFGPSWGPYTGLYGPLTPSYRLIEGILRRKARKSTNEECP